MNMIALTVNQRPVQALAEPRTNLADFVREKLLQLPDLVSGPFTRRIGQGAKLERGERQQLADVVVEIRGEGPALSLLGQGRLEKVVRRLRELLSRLDDADLRTRLGAAARADVVARWSWREHTRRIVEALPRKGVVK